MKFFKAFIDSYLRPLPILTQKRLDNRNSYLKEIQEYTGIKIGTETDANNIPLESPLKNGDKILITWLPSCRNVPNGTPNPYIGMSGTVQDSDHEGFILNTGSSLLIVNNVGEMSFTRI